MKEEFVSYEIAKRLKECGFDWEAAIFYTPDNLYGEPIRGCGECNYNRYKEEISAPSLSFAQKWLRDVKGISVRVNYMFDNELWFADLLNIKTREYRDTAYAFGSYKEALADGIDTALTLLTESHAD